MPKRQAARQKAKGNESRATSPTKGVNSSAIAMVRAIELWPLDRLVPFAKNPRDHSEEQVVELVASIREFGFNNPLLVRGEQIVAGHGRLLAARQLALKKVPVVRLNHLTKEQALAYLIADNKLALNATWNYDVLAELLAELPSLGIEPTLTGFDTEEIDAIIRGWKPEFDQPHPGNDEGNLVARVVVTCNPKDKAEVIRVVREAVENAGIEGAEVQT